MNNPYQHTWQNREFSMGWTWRILDEISRFLWIFSRFKDFSQFFLVPDTKRDSGNVPKEWRRFHEVRRVLQSVTISFPNSEIVKSSSAGIVNYSMSSHKKESIQAFAFIFLSKKANVGFRFQNVFHRDELICFCGKFLIKCCGKN